MQVIDYYLCKSKIKDEINTVFIDYFIIIRL